MCSSDLTLAITGPASMTYGDADATFTTSGGSGTGSVTYDAGASTACSIASGALHIDTAVGTCAITATKAGDADYLEATSAPFTVAVAKAPLAVIADSATVTYGDARPTLGFTYDGFVNGESAGVIAGAPVITTDYEPGDPVALSPVPVTIARGTLTATNYRFVLVDGAITIAKKTLFIDAVAASKSYGDADPALRNTLRGFVNGDSALTSGITGAASCTRSAGE